MASNQPIGHRPFRVFIYFLCSFLFVHSQPIQAQCTASGPMSAGSAASVPGPGSDYAFNNVTYSLAPDNNRSVASALIAVLNWETERLQVTNFGFSIPPTAIICGIEAGVERNAEDIGFNLFLLESYVTDRSVKLIKNGATTGSDLAAGAHWPSAESYASYGGSGNLWGTTWLPADINASDFGLSISANVRGLVGLMPKVLINHVRITVYYYIPPLLSLPQQKTDNKNLPSPEKEPVRCFPNPFTDHIAISGVPAGEQVLLTDVTGRNIYVKTRIGSDGIIRLDVGLLSPGIYIVKAGDVIKKLVKR